MKTFRLGLVICMFSFFLNCSNGTAERLSDNMIVKAAINPTCATRINFEDLDDNVYAYRADFIFGDPSLQAGGHSTSDESTDLGVNVFFDLENLTNMNYSISGASGVTGTAFVYYINGSTQYISTYDNTENLIINTIEVLEDGTISKLICSFNNVQVENNSISGDFLCINAFELVFNLEI